MIGIKDNKEMETKVLATSQNVAAIKLVVDHHVVAASGQGKPLGILNKSDFSIANRGSAEH